MFQVGDKIVHPMHGAGIVESIVQKKVNGVMRDYYVLKLPVRALSLIHIWTSSRRRRSPLVMSWAFRSPGMPVRAMTVGTISLGTKLPRTF